MYFNFDYNNFSNHQPANPFSFAQNSFSKKPMYPNFLPLGLHALLHSYSKLYPSQPNPLQITTVVKFFLGGQEPLDYISIYNNPGNPELNVPPHWHYVSYGLSDLYGDGRIHALPAIDSGPDPVSGMGFELTFRLIKTDNSQIPPTWPSNLMQSLAKYVFTSKNRFCPGDYIPWQKSLDSNNPESKIQHMLIAEDVQLEKIKTQLGSVTFCQIVGVTADEVEQASRYNGKAVMDLLKRDPRLGGPWLITDSTRTHSVFDLFPQTVELLEANLEREGSDLAGIDAEFFYRELPKVSIKTSLCLTMSSEKSLDFTRHLGRLDLRNSSENHSFHSSSSPFVGLNFLHRRVNLDGLELTFQPENTKFLKLAFKDRLRLGRHFTFQSPDLHLTFVAESVEGCFVTKDQPYCIQGKWMQVLIPADVLPNIIESFRDLETNDVSKLKVPLVFDFPEKNLRFIINHLSPANILR